MKNILALILCLCIIQSSQAQSKWKPWGIAEAGIIAGSYGPSGDLRLQGGLRTHGWLFGLGASYDGYKFQNLPVYAQARKMFGNKKIKPFVMASGGVNYEIQRDNPPSNVVYISVMPGIWAPPVISYQPGYYADLGAGLAFRTHKKFGYNLSFSYTRKTLNEVSDSRTWSGGVYEPVRNETKYIMNRYAFRIAMQF